MQQKPCPLAASKPVYPALPPTSPYILFIGEAPGAEEERQGTPFAGRSGQLLRRIIQASVIGTSHAVGFANVELHRPPANRVPTPAEVRPCLDALISWLVKRPPAGIVAVGATAARYAAGLKGALRPHIGRLTISSGLGTVHAPLTTIWHPAYLLRMEGGRDYAGRYRECLDALATLMDRVTSKPTFETPWTHASVYPQGAFAIDTEATSNDDPRAAVLDMVQIAGHNPVSVKVLSTMPTGWKIPEETVFHNAYYDLLMLKRHGAELPARVHDTMSIAQMLGEPSLALKPLVRKHLGLNVVEHAELPSDTEARYAYAAQDAVITLKLFKKWEPQITSAIWEPSYNIERELTPILTQMSLRGFVVDHSRLGLLMRSTAEELDRCLQAWRRLTQADANPRSPKQVLNWLNTLYGLKLQSSAEEGLLPLKHLPLVSVILALRRLEKQAQYCQDLAGKERVTSLWDSTFVQTGRLTCRSPNLQQLPPPVRACLTVEEGKELVTADYGQIELRVAACLSNDVVMLEALNRGVDLHTQVAEIAYGCKIENDDPRRQLAKRFNFERLYGGGINKGMRILGVSRARVEQVESAWPGWKRFAQKTVQQVRRDGVVYTWYGFPRYLLDITSRDPKRRSAAERQAINTPVQGTAGQITKRAMINASRAGLTILHQVHDSIEISVSASDQNAEQTLLSSMVEAVPDEWRKLCPWPVDVSAGSHWN